MLALCAPVSFARFTQYHFFVFNSSSAYYGVIDLVKPKIAEERASLDPDQPRHYLDSYLIEQARAAKGRDGRVEKRTGSEV